MRSFAYFHRYTHAFLPTALILIFAVFAFGQSSGSSEEATANTLSIQRIIFYISSMSCPYSVFLRCISGMQVNNVIRNLFELCFQIHKFFHFLFIKLDHSDFRNKSALPCQRADENIWPENRI